MVSVDVKHHVYLHPFYHTESTVPTLCCRFDKVPLVTPNGDVLIPDMSFEVGLVPPLVSLLLLDWFAW